MTQSQQTQKQTKRPTARRAQAPLATDAALATSGPSHTTRNVSLASAAGVAALAGLAFYFRKELMALMGFQKIHVAPHVQAKLPIAKDLQTVPDQDGNYDLDGVSYDTDGVVVGSDHQSSRGDALSQDMPSQESAPASSETQVHH